MVWLQYSLSPPKYMLKFYLHYEVLQDFRPILSMGIVSFPIDNNWELSGLDRFFKAYP